MTIKGNRFLTFFHEFSKKNEFTMTFWSQDNFFFQKNLEDAINTDRKEWPLQPYL